MNICSNLSKPILRLCASNAEIYKYAFEACGFSMVMIAFNVYHQLIVLLLFWRWLPMIIGDIILFPGFRNNSFAAPQFEIIIELDLRDVHFSYELTEEMVLCTVHLPNNSESCQPVDRLVFPFLVQTRIDEATSYLKVMCFVKSINGLFRVLNDGPFSLLEEQSVYWISPPPKLHLPINQIIAKSLHHIHDEEVVIVVYLASIPHVDVNTTLALVRTVRDFMLTLAPYDLRFLLPASLASDLTDDVNAIRIMYCSFNEGSVKGAIEEKMNTAIIKISQCIPPAIDLTIVISPEPNTISGDQQRLLLTDLIFKSTRRELIVISLGSQNATLAHMPLWLTAKINFQPVVTEGLVDNESYQYFTHSILPTNYNSSSEFMPTSFIYGCVSGNGGNSSVVGSHKNDKCASPPLETIFNSRVDEPRCNYWNRRTSTARFNFEYGHNWVHTTHTCLINRTSIALFSCAPAAPSCASSTSSNILSIELQKLLQQTYSGFYTKYPESYGWSFVELHVGGEGDDHDIEDSVRQDTQRKEVEEEQPVKVEGMQREVGKPKF